MSEIPESLKWIAIAAIRDGREGCERANRCKCEVGLGECDAKVAAIAYALMAERSKNAERLKDTEDMLRELRACFAVQPNWRDCDLTEGWARVEELRGVDAFLAIRGGSHD